MEDWSAVERRPLRCRPVLGQARSVKSRGSYGLRWTDVDFEAQTISIEITRVVVDGEVVEGGTKSETSRRVLPLIPELLAALRAAARIQAEEQLAAGPPASAAATWSSTLWGGATAPTRCRTTGPAACATAGVKRIRLHDAGHTCGTLMHLEHNVPAGWPRVWTRNTVEPMRTSGTGRDCLDG
jgi:integrase